MVLYPNKLPESERVCSGICKKLDSGDRNIKNDYVKYCHWRGKKIVSIERRRYAEFMLLFTI